MDYSDKSENYSDDNSSSFAPNASGPNEVRLLKRCFDRIMDDVSFFCFCDKKNSNVKEQQWVEIIEKKTESEEKSENILCF